MPPLSKPALKFLEWLIARPTRHLTREAGLGASGAGRDPPTECAAPAGRAPPLDFPPSGPGTSPLSHPDCESLSHI